MKWFKQVMYVQRDDATGAIVRIQEDKPNGYISTHEERLSKASRASTDVEKDITEYAKQKAKKKRLTIGG